jgi:hypothetical protein
MRKFYESPHVAMTPKGGHAESGRQEGTSQYRILLRRDEVDRI